MSAPIKVMRIIDRLNVGGPAIHAVLTTRGLDPERFETILVYGSVEPGEADMGDLADAIVKKVVIPSLGRELRPLKDLRTAWQLYRLMRRERPAVVHTHKSKAGAIGRLCAFLAGVPVRVHTYHGHVFTGYFSPRKTQAFLMIERGLARLSTRLVTLSSGLLEELSQDYRIAARDRFAVVPLGLDLQPFSDCARHAGALRRELGVAEGTRLIGIVGRMVPVKDHATFVAAAALLAARRDDVHFVFIGGGELEAEVRSALERHGISGRASLLGWRRDLDRLYADLDVVALSSVNEGTPVALIEAMSSGVPVVGTQVGGVSDVLRGGARGRLVPARDPQALADAVDAALSDESRAHAARIREEVMVEFGSARLCRDLERLYLGHLPR
jgi:glycosyltransferase involved in cell wall biosynthesis